jgi:hypothetical protein
MNNKLLMGCLIACVAAGVSACDEGKYNELLCDSAYQANCLDGTHAMACQNGHLVIVQCATNQYCNTTTGACVNYSNDQTPSTNQPVCGNGIIEPGEACENNNVNGKTCVDFMGQGATGAVSCVNCQLNFSNCQPANVNPVNNCGNGIIDANEDCDSTNLNGRTCADVIGAGATGTLACNPSTCKFDSSACVVPQPQNAICGNGIIEGNEICDRNAFPPMEACPANTVPAILSCKDDCSGIINSVFCDPIPETCGNAQIDTGEECDGNQLNNRTCETFLGLGTTGSLKCTAACKYDLTDCKVPSVCGNGIIEGDEICDKNAFPQMNECPAGTVPAVLSCKDDCSGIVNTVFCDPIPSSCGNGQIDSGEECDGSQFNNRTCETFLGVGSTGTLKCTGACKYDLTECHAPAPQAVCGNGVIEGNEVCDKNAFAPNAAPTCPTGTAPIPLVCKDDCSGIANTEFCESIPANCGNGQLDGEEECDGSQLNNKTCEAFLGAGASGTLKCTGACKYDVTECVAPVVPPTDGICHSDADCDNAVCSHGVCISEDMLALKAGDPCDVDTFAEFCNGSSLVYCGEDDNGSGAVIMDDCAQYGGCAIVDMKDLYGSDGSILQAWCNNDASQCTEAGQKIHYCTTYTQGEPPFDYASYTLCAKNTDGGFTAFDGALQLGIYGVCKSGENLDSCNTEKTECSNPEPFECEYATKCEDANTLSTCQDYSSWGLGILANTYACSEAVPGSTCATVNDTDFCFVPCDKEGEVKKSCKIDTNYGSEFVSISTCTKGNDGKLYWVEESIDCDHACDATKFECTKVVDNEGDSCDPETFQSSCVNNARISCSESWTTGEDVVTASECYEGTTCVVTEKGPSCMTPCENVGEKTSECYNALFYYGYSKYECQAFEAGNFYAETESGACDEGCNETMTECAAADPTKPADLGESCDPNTFADRCDGNWMVSCYQGTNGYVVDGINCGNYDGLHCAIVSLGEESAASCFGEADKCQNVNEPSKQCQTVNDVQYSYDYMCLSASDGNNYNTAINRTACSSTCDESTGICNKLIEDEGKACDPYEMQDECRGDILVYCYQNAITSLNCGAYEGVSCQLSHQIYSGDDVYGDCVEKCDAESPATNVCQYSSNFGQYVVYRVACENINGQLYQFNAAIKGCSSCNAEGTDCAE